MSAVDTGRICELTRPLYGDARLGLASFRAKRKFARQRADTTRESEILQDSAVKTEKNPRNFISRSRRTAQKTGECGAILESLSRLARRNTFGGPSMMPGHFLFSISLLVMTLALPKVGLSDEKRRDTDPYAEDVLRRGLVSIMQATGALTRAETEMPLFKGELQRSVRKSEADGAPVNAKEIFPELAQSLSEPFDRALAAIRASKEAASDLSKGLTAHKDILGAAGEVATAKEGGGLATGRRMAALLSSLEKAEAAASAAALASCAASLALNAAASNGVLSNSKEYMGECATFLGSKLVKAAKIIEDRHPERSNGFGLSSVSLWCRSTPGACAASLRLAVAVETIGQTRAEIQAAIAGLKPIVTSPLYDAKGMDVVNPLYTGGSW